jgi:hypothetical protein
MTWYGARMDAAEFFRGEPDALAIHCAVEAALASIGGAGVRVSKSQIGFYRRHPFAATWKPSQYLAGERPPLVLSVYLPARDSSSRWKEVVEPSNGRFTHHIELWSERDVDEFVRSKLREAWQHAA